jgi:erythromycin esterase
MASEAAGSDEMVGIRDRSMAENAQWLLTQAGPNARMVLWAHNVHVQNGLNWMGWHLRQAHGDAYVNLGFLFGRGGFNAVGPGTAGLRPWNASIVPAGTLEAVFLATRQPLLLFDTRRILDGGDDAAPLGGPISMRAIGAGFDSAVETSYYSPYIFPSDFDLLIFIESTTPSTLLPFRP